MPILRSAEVKILVSGQLYSMECPYHGTVAPAIITTPTRDKNLDLIPATLSCGTNIERCPKGKDHTLESGPRVNPDDIFDLMGELQFMKYCIDCGVNIMSKNIMCTLTDGIEHLFDQRTDPYRYR